MLWLWKRKEEISFDWLCSEKKCEEFWKELLKIFTSSKNIWKLEKRLERCNKCYLEKEANHTTVKVTRWILSTEVHHYNSK